MTLWNKTDDFLEFTFDTMPLPDGRRQLAADAVDSPAADALASELNGWHQHKAPARVHHTERRTNRIRGQQRVLEL